MAIAYAAGTAYVAPRAISAQAIRAVLLASATATTVALLADPDLAFGPATAVGLRRQSSQAANWRPDRNNDASGTLAAGASRRLASLVRCHLRISASALRISCRGLGGSDS